MPKDPQLVAAEAERKPRPLHSGLILPRGPQSSKSELDLILETRGRISYSQVLWPLDVVRAPLGLTLPGPEGRGSHYRVRTGGEECTTDRSATSYLITLLLKSLPKLHETQTSHTRSPVEGLRLTPAAPHTSSPGAPMTSSHSFICS